MSELPSSKNSVCRLCLRMRELQYSHIIPEFFHRRIYDEKGRALAIKAGKPKPDFIQKGTREQLLCSECEILFSREYERPFAEYWYKKNPLPSQVARGSRLELRGFDYRRFKLLLLSIAGGCIWNLVIGQKAFPEFAPFSLKEDGSITLATTRLEEFRIAHEFFREQAALEQKAGFLRMLGNPTGRVRP